MGTASRHLPCLIPKVIAQRQIFLHNDEKRGIGKKLLLTVRTATLDEHVDMVAGDFNGASWRRPCGSDRRLISIIEEAFANTNLPIPPGLPTVL